MAPIDTAIDEFLSLSPEERKRFLDAIKDELPWDIDPSEEAILLYYDGNGEDLRKLSGKITLISDKFIQMSRGDGTYIFNVVDVNRIEQKRRQT